MPELLESAATIDLTLSYLDELDALGNAVGRAIREIFEGLTVVEKESLAEFVREASPYINAGNTAGADLASAYLAELTGQTPALIDLRFAEAPLDSAYHRMWKQMGQGYEYDDARRSGASVAESTGYDSAHEGGSKRMAHPGTKVRGYRRVINPTACEWCQVVSTQLYRSAESAHAARHHHCKCTVVAVAWGDHSGAKINQARLKSLKESGAINRASAARERNRARSR